MICPFCGQFMQSVDKKSLMVKGTKLYLHKKCLRSATHEQLIFKGLIQPDDRGWWTKLSGDN